MFQRAIDIIIFFFILPFSLPIILIICITNLFILGNPIFLFRKEVDFRGKQIKVFKFRTMQYFNQKEKSISKYGLFLRKTKLDELPQIFNLLRGE